MGTITEFSIGKIENNLETIKKGLGSSYISCSLTNDLTILLGFKDFANNLDCLNEVTEKIIKYFGIKADYRAKVYSSELIIEIIEQKLIIKVFKY